VTLLALALLAAAASAPPPAHCAVGAHTTLDVEVLDRPRVPRHDGSIGRDRLVRRGPKGKEIFEKDTREGQWKCLGYDRAKARYIVGVYQEVGVWLVVSGIYSLAEDGTQLEPTAFSRQRYLAMTWLTSPSGRYVAFVGGLDFPDGLYVLDTEADTVRHLGRPPAPPPLGDDDDFDCDEPFGWGSCWVGDYQPLEPKVLRFDGDATLVITRGHDTPKRRAKKRVEERVRL
jgi:hypothetical protein